MLSEYEVRRKVSVRREVQSRLWNTEGRETGRRSTTPGDRLPSGFCDLLLHVDRVVLKAVATEVVGHSLVLPCAPAASEVARA